MEQRTRKSPVDMPIALRLGRNIRLLRTERGWTQDVLAELAGLHRNYIGHVERGEFNISIAQLVKIARAFGVRMGVLVDNLF